MLILKESKARATLHVIRFLICLYFVILLLWVVEVIFEEKLRTRMLKDAKMPRIQSLSWQRGKCNALNVLF